MIKDDGGRSTPLPLGEIGFKRIFALFSNVMLEIVQPLGWRVWVMCCRRIYRCHLEYNIHRFGDETLPWKNATWNTTFIALGMKDHLEKMLPGKNTTWKKCHLEYNIHYFGDERPPEKYSSWSTKLLVDTMPLWKRVGPAVADYALSCGSIYRPHNRIYANIRHPVIDEIPPGNLKKKTHQTWKTTYKNRCHLFFLY